MSLLQTLAGGASPSVKTYVDDVFSAFTYTGNGTTQTITNGIDLAGKGGMVWGKHRNGPTGHILTDTVHGYNSQLTTNTTNAANNATTLVTSFTSTGFTLGSGASLNGSGDTYVSWTFRKSPKFFDVQTATLSSGNATVSFTDLATLGMVIVKRTDSTGSWYVWHRSLTAGKLLYLEQTAAEATLGHITVSGTTLTLVDGVLADGDYVCYGFAHDTSADGIIQCGSYTGNASANGPTVTLGWEPQYLLIKRSSALDDWAAIDVMRGMTGSSSERLVPNAAGAASSSSVYAITPTSTGFKLSGADDSINGSSTYIYLAIRRPNKPPTVGTQVYNAIARTGTGAAATVTGVGFAPDAGFIRGRTNGGYPFVNDRLRGAQRDLFTNTADAEVSTNLTTLAFLMDGVSLGTDSGCNSSGQTYINHFFKRAPGVFDEVCYTGTGVTKTEAHNLGVVPELMIVKKRSAADAWYVYHAGNTANPETDYLALNSTAATADLDTIWNDTAPTSSVFTVGTNDDVNQITATFVAYLFATKPGISKVGSYTGNGSSQTINCGFTTGARFILIKRTDSTGDWFVWDSVRGIIAGNDPHLSLNTTAAEVTTDDSIDPDTSGFVVNQDAATNINVNAATYIYLSFA